MTPAPPLQNDQSPSHPRPYVSPINSAIYAARRHTGAKCVNGIVMGYFGFGTLIYTAFSPSKSSAPPSVITSSGLCRTFAYLTISLARLCPGLVVFATNTVPISLAFLAKKFRWNHSSVLICLAFLSLYLYVVIYISKCTF